MNESDKEFLHRLNGAARRFDQLPKEQLLSPRNKKKMEQHYQVLARGYYYLLEKAGIVAPTEEAAF